MKSLNPHTVSHQSLPPPRELSNKLHNTFSSSNTSFVFCVVQNPNFAIYARTNTGSRVYWIINSHHASLSSSNLSVCFQGIEYLYENHLLKTDEHDVAQFLYKGEGLNKTAIGECSMLSHESRDVISRFLPSRWLLGREEAIQRESAESFRRTPRLHKPHPGASFKVNKLDQNLFKTFLSVCLVFPSSRPMLLSRFIRSRIKLKF